MAGELSKDSKDWLSRQPDIDDHLDRAPVYADTDPASALLDADDLDGDPDPFEDLIPIERLGVSDPTVTPELLAGVSGPGPEGARRIRETNRIQAEIDTLVQEAYRKGYEDGVRSESERSVMSSDKGVDAVHMGGIQVQLEQHRLSESANFESRSRRIARLAVGKVRR